MTRTQSPPAFIVEALGRLSDFATMKTVGYKVPRLSREMFRTFGVRKAIAWGRHIERAVQLLTTRYGDRNAQALIAFAALWRGCSFCSYGHLLAANLYHFRQAADHFPLAETDVEALRMMRDPDAIAHVEQALAAPRYTLIRTLLRRQYDLFTETAEGHTNDDQHLSLILAAWGFVTECSIVESLEDIPPLAPISKNHALLARYRETRNHDHARDLERDHEHDHNHNHEHDPEPSAPDDLRPPSKPTMDLTRPTDFSSS